MRCICSLACTSRVSPVCKEIAIWSCAEQISEMARRAMIGQVMSISPGVLNVRRFILRMARLSLEPWVPARPATGDRSHSLG